MGFKKRGCRGFAAFRRKGSAFPKLTQRFEASPPLLCQYI
jgi:hypothetical protein